MADLKKWPEAELEEMTWSGHLCRNYWKSDELKLNCKQKHIKLNTNQNKNYKTKLNYNLFVPGTPANSSLIL